jgi:hypothetical protein
MPAHRLARTTADSEEEQRPDAEGIQGEFMNDIVSNTEVAGVSTDTPNPFLADAQQKIALIRAISAAFPDTADPQPLSVAERQLAAKTTIAFLEKSALFVDAAPAVGAAVSDAASVREAALWELAYGGVVDEAMTLVRRVVTDIARKKLKAAIAARAIYRVGKGFVTSHAGDGLRPHVAEMKRTLTKRPKKRATKNSAPA